MSDLSNSNGRSAHSTFTKHPISAQNETHMRQLVPQLGSGFIVTRRVYRNPTRKQGILPGELSLAHAAGWDFVEFSNQGYPKL
ncbi:MAG: hypothetical protein ACK5YR_15080 [Pirellula sp.]